MRREIGETLFAYTRVWIIIKQIIQIVGGALFKKDSWGSRRKLILDITITDNFTLREKEVQSWFEEEVKRGRRRRL